MLNDISLKLIFDSTGQSSNNVIEMTNNKSISCFRNKLLNIDDIEIKFYYKFFPKFPFRITSKTIEKTTKKYKKILKKHFNYDIHFEFINFKTMNSGKIIFGCYLNKIDFKEKEIKELYYKIKEKICWEEKCYGH